MTQKQPPILRNLDKFSPGAFYLTPLQLSTKEKITFLDKCVSFRQKYLDKLEQEQVKHL